MAGLSILKIQRIIPILIVTLFSIRTAAVGKTIHVGVSGQSDFDTIQAGIDAANDGDTVLVGPGEYVISEPITFGGKAITVRSEAGPEETTIRMGSPTESGRASVVIFENGETATSVLDGFTITGGKGLRLIDSSVSLNALMGGGIYFNASSGTLRNCDIMQSTAEYGGGISCWDNSLVTVSNCTIMENSAIVRGGGVFCGKSSSLTLTDCTIKGNRVTGTTIGVAGYGGGVSCTRNSPVTLTNCNIEDNSAGVGGGGMFFYGSPSTVDSCIISGNSAGTWGGGVGGEVDGTRVTMKNCVIARNTAGQGGGGVAGALFTTLTISNCTIWGNMAGSNLGGGGVACWQGSAMVTNSIIWANTSPKGDEIALAAVAGVTVGSPSKLTLDHSNVAGGQAAAYMEAGHTLNWSGSNIDADPYFADLANNDYHLKSQAGRWDPNSQSWVQDDVTSPCIDAGDVNSDWKAELWPHGIRANMGAYGSTLQASRSLSDAGNIADLNRDGIVDSADICMMVDHWQTDEPYCDIAPVPFGDGMVDVQDMALLGENLFEDYYLDLLPMVAHWKMDETSGNSAYDIVSGKIGKLHGDPIWQPDNGYIDGALMLDGIDDYISTDFILNPVDGSFSVFAWVKGGNLGQVIISQLDHALGRTVLLGSIWLGINPSDGSLITGLMGSTFGELESESVIIDDQWHHLGLVYDLDSLQRRLYVDGVQVAEDMTAISGMSSDGSMNIGAGKNLDSGTFFSGLIDDIRIYNVALSAEEIAALAQ